MTSARFSDLRMYEAVLYELSGQVEGAVPAPGYQAGELPVHVVLHPQQDPQAQLPRLLLPLTGLDGALHGQDPPVLHILPAS